MHECFEAWSRLKSLGIVRHRDSDTPFVCLAIVRYFDRPEPVALGVVLHAAPGVENHGRELPRGHRLPGGQAVVTRVAVAGEVDPRPADRGGEVERLGQAAGEVHASVGVVEDERDLGAVERPGAAVKLGGPPGEPAG